MLYNPPPLHARLEVRKPRRPSGPRHRADATAFDARAAVLSGRGLWSSARGRGAGGARSEPPRVAQDGSVPRPHAPCGAAAGLIDRRTPAKSPQRTHPCHTPRPLHAARWGGVDCGARASRWAVSRRHDVVADARRDLAGGWQRGLLVRGLPAGPCLGVTMLWRMRGVTWLAGGSVDWWFDSFPLVTLLPARP